MTSCTVRGLGVWLHSGIEQDGGQREECLELIELARSIGDVEAIAMATTLVTAAQAVLGDGPQFRTALTAASTAAARARQPFYEAVCLQLAAMDAQITGDFERCERLAGEALVTVRGSELFESSYGAQLWALRRDQGRHDELIELLEAAADSSPQVPAWRAALAATLSTATRSVPRR